MSDTPLTVTALDRILEVTTLLGDDMASALGDLGLTPSRTHLLWVVAQSGPSTQRALADALDVSPRNVTGLVDALVESGFVVREPHPEDRRAFLVSLTDKGEATCASLQEGQTTLAGQLFDDVDAEMLRTLVAGLDHVVARLRTLLEEARHG
ncbi:MarR family winged helix-turn-helix transcriptional regulator [Mumia sp. DW29H23]|uniref:MarR family winged helix-turn-helix transcriptional regulator n=1 Tax=Mumia sp. DW29H23 TaxID=3421241 RepID=UPI003D685FE8